MCTIYLLSTGGTIEKVYSEQTGTAQNIDSKIEQYLRKLRLPRCDVQVVPLMNKDSLEMTADDRVALAAELERLLPEKHPIIISHGTDTMVETGLYIQNRFPSLEVPIILTGAMTPLGFEGSDGLQNLTESLLAARLIAQGVHIVFHGQVFPITHVRKDRALATFVSVK